MIVEEVLGSAFVKNTVLIYFIIIIFIPLKKFFHWSAAAAAKSLQSCPTLCDPMDCSPPGSSVPGMLQARVLECFYWSKLC